MPRPESVGGVVLPPVNYFAIVVLALFSLWVAYFLFRKMVPRYPGLIRFGSRHVDAMSVKPGPTQSGDRMFVGGVVLPAVNYLVLGILALLILWIGFFLFRKRSAVIKFFAPTLLRLMRT